LTLRACGVRDLRAFPWFEPPEPRSLDRAEQLLRDLGAIEPGSGALTGLGRRMASFPLHPRYARMLLAAEQYRCVRPVALIAALTQGRSLLVRGSGKDARDAREERLGAEGRSDFFVLMRAWNYAQRNQYALEACRKMGIHAATARQVGPLYSHFLHVAEKEGLALEEAPAPDEAVQKCVLAGFSDQVAARRDTGTLRCQLVHGRRGDLDRDSTVQESRLLVASEVREVEGRDIQVRLSLATAVDEAWLAELFPGDLREEEAVEWEAEARRVVAVRRRLFRDLVLGQKRGGEVNAEAAATLLAGEVLAGRCPLKAWTPAVEQWINRVNFLHRQCPDAGLPSLGPDERRLALEQICLGAQSYKEVKDRDPWPVLRSFLTPAQFDLLEQWAPERIGLPGGRRARVTYEPDQEPVAAATIQDLYGAPNRLTVAGGRVPVVIQVLAPNQRPVQMTRDLAGFWREVYPRVKQELQRKYPKHEWR
jgi:ATP-dependent helicase HrpB